MSMIITYTDTARYGKCEKCGKSFIRRAVDTADDGKLCRDCYLKRKEGGEYCKGIECVGSIVGLDYVKDTLAYISERKGTPVLVLEQDCGSVSITTYEPIKFCPMCGEKLRKEGGDD